MRQLLIFLNILIFLGLSFCGTSNLVKLEIKTNYDQINIDKFNHVLADDVAVAYYGHVPYGSVIIGQLEVLEEEHQACQPITQLEDDYQSKIYLAKRGGCFFSQKTRNIQNAGGLAAVLFNTELDVEEKIAMGSVAQSNLQIPTIMLGSEAQRVLYEPLLQLKKLKVESPLIYKSLLVKMKITFKEPKQKSKALLDFWMHSFDWNSYELIYKIKNDYQFSELLSSKNVIFTPHYPIWYCSDCGEDFQTYDDPHCIKGGRYCAPDPDDFTFINGPLVGADVIKEDLRQICIWNNYKNEKDTTFADNKWVTYTHNFQEECVKSVEYKDNFDLEKCSMQVQKEVGIDISKIQECYDKEYQPTRKNNIISVLEEEKNTFVEEAIQIWPSLFINNYIYRGELSNFREGDEDDTSLIDTICRSIRYKRIPDVCKEILNPTTLKEEASQGHSKLTMKIILIILISALIIFLTLYIINKRIIRQDMNKEVELQVNSAVSQYIAFYEQQKSQLMTENK